MMLLKKALLGAMAGLFLSLPLAGHGAEVDWNKASETNIVLFYPGVTSWDFLTSEDHRLGGKEIKQTRKDCRHCHLGRDGELDLKADEIAAGSARMKKSHDAFEPEPLAGKKGIIRAAVSAAYDNEYLYLRVVWTSKGTGWLGKKDTTPDRISIQLNKSEPVFAKYGCFTTCHNDLNTMPKSPSKDQVGSDPFYKNRGHDDVRLYAFYAKRSWSDKKSPKDLEKLLNAGARIDLESIEFTNGKSIPSEGWIFDDRLLEEKPGLPGSGAFTNGRYTAVFKRRLKSNEAHGVSLKPGDVVSIGIAIHDDGAAKRKHYVSFPMTVGLGTGADIKADKVSN